MTCGLQDKNFAFYPTCDSYALIYSSYAYRMHIQDGRMHAAFDQNKSIYFENEARYGIIVKEGYEMFFQIRQT